MTSVPRWTGAFTAQTSRILYFHAWNIVCFADGLMHRFVSLAAISALVLLPGCAAEPDSDPVAESTTADDPETEGEESSGTQGPQSDESGTEGAGSDTTTTGEPEVYEGAQCFELSAFETELGDEAITLVDTCDTPAPCSGLGMHCPDEGEHVNCDVESGVLSDVEEADTLTCLLMTLASGEDARVGWGYTEAAFPGYARRSHQVWIVNGRWFHATEHSVDLSGWFGGFHEVEPLTDESLEACLAAEADADRTACLANPRTRSIGEVYPPEDGFE